MVKRKGRARKSGKQLQSDPTGRPSPDLNPRLVVGETTGRLIERSFTTTVNATKRHHICLDDVLYRFFQSHTLIWLDGDRFSQQHTNIYALSVQSLKKSDKTK